MAVNTVNASDNRLDECDAVGVLSNSNEIQQDETESTYVAGRYVNVMKQNVNLLI